MLQKRRNTPSSLIVKRFMAFLATIATIAGMSSVLLAAAPQAAAQNFSGTVTGMAFRDFNSNGQMDTTRSASNPAADVGIAGVTVNAYDSTGIVVGTATTDSTGAYTLSFTNSETSTVRLEFTPPTGYDIGPVGTGTTGIQSGGNVQFASNGDTANVGLVAPGDFCDSNPTVVVPCEQGAINQQNDINTLAPTDEPALLSFAYDTSGDYAAADTENSSSTVAQIGSTWGEATYNVDGGQYSLEATYFKRHAELGDGGAGSLGAIYITNLASGTPNGTTWTTVPNAGTDPRIAAYGPESGMTFNQWLDDTPGYEYADKIGLGGMSMSPDQKTLYVVNLADRNLYAIPMIAPTTVGGEPTAGTPQVISLPLTLPGASAGCAAADVRPMAVQAEVTAIYVGLTCTGPTQADLRGYIYAINPATGTASTSPLLEIPFSGYGRGDSYSLDNLSATWEPWTSTTFESTGTSQDWASYPQPLVSAISFDAYGNMTVAVKDRNGDQVGSQTPAPGTTSPTLEGIQAGDLLLACTNASDTWTLESNGSCTSTTEGTTLRAGGEGNWNTAGTGGSGDGFGPGGGDFYFQHYDVGSGGSDGGAGTAPATTAPAHDHTEEGGVAQIPGFADVIATNLDPISADIPGGTSSYYQTNGTINESNTNGGDDSTAGGLILSSANGLTSENQASFGKANGLGDVAVLCSSAPVEIGNRVWIDETGNGIQEPGDPGVAGVTVTLTNKSGTVVGTTTTDSHGDYLFNDSNVTGGLTSSTDYTISVDKASDFATGGPLAGYQPTTEGVGSDTAINSKGVATGTVGATAAATSPSVGADLDYDFGFEKIATCAVGDTAFLDTNGNGTQDTGEPPLAGVTVTLFTSTGTQVASQTTGSNGLYLFDDLPCGDYYETFAAPAGSGDRPTTQVAPALGVVNSTPSATTGRTAVFELGAGLPDNEASSSYTTQPVTADTINPAIDAGFQPANCSVGSTVFVDSNGNGTQNTGEQPLPGVAVTLYSESTHAPVTTQVNGQPLPSNANPVYTDSTGHYYFDNLACGTYYESFTPPAGYNITQAVAPSLTAVDSQPGSNGFTPTFTLAYTPTVDQTTLNEPTSDYTVPSGATLPGGESSLQAETINPTVDAGYTPPSCAVGSTVFVDTNGNGTQDTGETPLAGATVTIFNADGTAPAFAANGSAYGSNSQVTGANGQYLFDDLPCGSYYETFTPPTGSGLRLTTYVAPTTETAVNSDINDTSVTGLPSDQTPDFTLSAAQPLNETAAAYKSATGTTIVAATINPTVNAGFQPANCAVGSTVFVDTNLNGTQDTGESGLAGVQVTLYQVVNGTGQKVQYQVNNATLTNPATTDSTGHYYFDNLPCGGTYYETFTPPAGYSPTQQQPPSLTDVNSTPTGDQSPNFTLSYTPTVDQTTLNEPTSDYTVPNGATLPGGEASLQAETINPTIDAGFQPASCAVGSTVFVDTNGNGTQNTGEQPLAGVQVYLYPAGSTTPVQKQLDGNNLTQPAVTDTNGHYIFDDIACGSYYETFTPPTGSGLRLTTYAAPSPTAVDSDINDTSVTGLPSDQTPDFTLGAGLPDNEASSSYTTQPVTADTINPAIDAGFQPANCAVGSTVFEDFNGNGTQNAGEPGVPGVTVTLYTSSGQKVQDQLDGSPLTNPVTTNSSGHYLFDDLACGSYYETFSVPTGYTVSPSVTPSLTSVNSQPNSSGRTPVFTLGSGSQDNEPSSSDTTETATAQTINPTIDAGLIPTSCAVGDTTFVDVHGNGIDGSGDSALAGVTVTLYSASTNSPVTTHLNETTLTNPVTTNSSGRYLFDDLPCGSYYETFTPPTGYSATTEVTPPSSLTAVDSQPVASTDRTPNFTLGLGATDNESSSSYKTQTVSATLINPTVDAGFVIDGNITGTVFLDSNKDGTQNGGEPGVGGITVILINPATGATVATTKTNSSGGYSFPDVPPGKYDVEVVKPSGSSFTTASAGTVTVPVDGTGIFNAGVVPQKSSTSVIPTGVPAGGGFLPTHRSVTWMLLMLLALAGLLLTGWGGARLLLQDSILRPRYAGWSNSAAARHPYGRITGRWNSVESLGRRRRTRWRT
jgi:hypothetical protein